MIFEEQIREMGKKIYEKIVFFINANKDDDELYYNYAFVRLNNGQEIRYNFEEKTISIPYSEECDYDWIMGTKIRISEDNTEITLELDNEPIPRNTYVSYDTGLNEKIDNCQIYNLKLLYKRQLLEQRKMTRELKGQIKQEYNQLNSALCNLTYEKEKIHNIENFNYDVFDIYQSYMYDKEERELANSSETIYPAVKIAVDWWIKRIRNPIEKNSYELSPWLKKPPILPITDDQLSKFRTTLEKTIMTEISESEGDLVRIGSYEYSYLFKDAINESKIDFRRIPKFINMYIRNYWVEVEEERKETKIYDSTTKEDLERVKSIYQEQLNSSNTFTLKRD